jgi:hypothetical protein
MLNHGNILVQLLHCLSLSSCQLESNCSTHCAVASVAISTGRPALESSATFERPWENFSTQLWTALHEKHQLKNRKHFFINILCTESFCAQKTHNRMLLYGSILLKHGRYFDYWNQPLNLRIRVCYLDCHEAGLCCYLLIHIENISCTLQLFYFHLWPIYSLSLVVSSHLRLGLCSGHSCMYSFS